MPQNRLPWDNAYPLATLDNKWPILSSALIRFSADAGRAERSAVLR